MSSILTPSAVPPGYLDHKTLIRIEEAAMLKAKQAIKEESGAVADEHLFYLFGLTCIKTAKGISNGIVKH